MVGLQGRERTSSQKPPSWQSMNKIMSSENAYPEITMELSREEPENSAKGHISQQDLDTGCSQQ